jgi:hypothetical protein
MMAEAEGGATTAGPVADGGCAGFEQPVRTSTNAIAALAAAGDDLECVTYAARSAAWTTRRVPNARRLRT